MAEEFVPFGLPLIVCDGIHVDPATGKKTLLGLFSVMAGRSFPLSAQPFFLYAALTEWHGKAPVTVRIVDANEERDPVFRVEGEVECDNPLAVLDIAFRLGGVVFPEPGEYRIQLYCGGTPIAERRLIVADAGSIGPPAAPDQPTEEPDDDA